MLTSNQSKRLNYLSVHPIQNIRDMSLLSLAFQKTQWRGFPVVYRPLWWVKPQIKPRTAIFVPGSEILYQHVQTSFLEHFLTLDATKKIQFVKECFLQVAKMLSNMTYYVHGDLTIENIMTSTNDGNKYQFYIIDRCVFFDRKKYCDLRTLYISILELFEKPFPIFFNAFTNIYLFDPVLFIRHIESI
jgi:hypothetical protein